MTHERQRHEVPGTLCSLSFEADGSIFEARDAMASTEIIVTVVYVLLTACLVAPPTEFISAGITVQNLLAPYLGSENMNFVYYHIKRTSFTVLFHSLLPLGRS